MPSEENSLSDKLWEIYGERWPLPLHSATQDHVWYDFKRRGYSTEADIPKFMTAVAFDEWCYAEHGEVGDWPEGWHPRDVKYMNVYETDQVYGGPEEGGWYYTAGNPLASLPIPIDTLHDEIQDLYVKVCKVLGRDPEDRDMQLDIQNDYAYPFPRERPHYE